MERIKSETSWCFHIKTNKIFSSTNNFTKICGINKFWIKSKLHYKCYCCFKFVYRIYNIIFLHPSNIMGYTVSSEISNDITVATPKLMYGCQNELLQTMYFLQAWNVQCCQAVYTFFTAIKTVLLFLSCLLLLYQRRK